MPAAADKQVHGIFSRSGDDRQVRAADLLDAILQFLRGEPCTAQRLLRDDDLGAGLAIPNK